MEKKVLKFFTVDNFEKEEVFLRQMSLKGWHFTHYKGLKYCFEKGESMNIYYRIDYNSPAEEGREDYLQLFEDSGWTTVFTYPIFDGEWCYFRKAADEEKAPEIFTDSASKVELFRKIRKTWSTFGLLLSIIYLPLIMLTAVNGPAIIVWLLFLLLGFIVLLYSKMTINLTKKINQLSP